MNAGALYVTGAIASSAVSVASGATFGGSGSAGAVTLASGASLAPGASGNGSIGTLSAVSLTWNGGAVLRFDLANTGSADLLSLSGTFTKGTAGTFAFDFLNLTPAVGTYTLVTASAVSGFSASDFSVLNLGAGRSASFAFVGNNLTLAVTAIPELLPGASLAFASLASLGLARRRRR